MKSKVVDLVGEYEWTMIRHILIKSLQDCSSKKEFLILMDKLYNSMGTKKELIKRRKSLKLKPYSKEDLKKFKDKK